MPVSPCHSHLLYRVSRVLDFTNLLAGPFPCLLLGMLGAEVIKIESNVQLDAARRVPYSSGDPDGSPLFNSVNLNKMSLQLNLKEPQAIELVQSLVSISDAVVENMRPRVMARLGLGYQRLQEINPTLVYAAISGAGSTGPESSYPGYAPAFSAMAGLGHLTGYPDGPPAQFQDSIDSRVGATAAFAILSALFHRLRTGQGQFIDQSSIEAITVFSGEALMEFAMNGEVATRMGNRSPRIAPHGCYQSKGEDRWVTIAVASESEWQALCRGAGHPEWESDGRFADNNLRIKNQDVLDRLIESWTRRHAPEDAAPTASSCRGCRRGLDELRRPSRGFSFGGEGRLAAGHPSGLGPPSRAGASLEPQRNSMLPFARPDRGLASITTMCSKNCCVRQLKKLNIGWNLVSSIESTFLMKEAVCAWKAK